MTTFSPADVALEGFKVVKQNPGVILPWWLIQLAAATTTVVLLVVLGISQAASEMEAFTAANPEPSPEQAMQIFGLLGRMSGGLVVVMVATLGLAMLQVAATFRAVLRPGEGGVGFLRFGPDELRLLVVVVVVYVFLFVALMIGAVAVSLIGGILTIANPALGGVAFILGFAGLFVIMVWLGVKFSLAGPQTFAQGRINLFGSWKLTAGRFWPVFAGFFIAILLGLVVTLLGLVIALAGVAAFGGGMSAIGVVLNEPYTTFAEAFTPARIVYLIVTAMFAALYTAILNSPAAAMYEAIAGKGQSSVF